MYQRTRCCEWVEIGDGFKCWRAAEPRQMETCLLHGGQFCGGTYEM